MSFSSTTGPSAAADKNSNSMMLEDVVVNNEQTETENASSSFAAVVHHHHQRHDQPTTTTTTTTTMGILKQSSFPNNQKNAPTTALLKEHPQGNDDETKKHTQNEKDETIPTAETLLQDQLDRTKGCSHKLLQEIASYVQALKPVLVQQGRLETAEHAEASRLDGIAPDVEGAAFAMRLDPSAVAYQEPMTDMTSTPTSTSTSNPKSFFSTPAGPSLGSYSTTTAPGTADATDAGLSPSDSLQNDDDDAQGGPQDDAEL